MHLSIAQTEQKQTSIRIPLNASQWRILQFFSPNSIAVHWTDNDCAVFVHDANLLAIRRPRHSLHSRFLAIVCHFFVPRILCKQLCYENKVTWCLNLHSRLIYLVQHPNHDDTISIGSCQLLLCVIPANDVDWGLVTFEGLIHAQIAGGCSARTSWNHIGRIRLIQFQHFHQSLIATDGNITLIFIPCDAIDSSIIRYRDLCTSMKKN